MKINATHSKNRPISKLASKLYSPETVIDKTLHGSRGDENMQDIFNNIFQNPHITLGTPDKQGNMPIFYFDKDIGWVNPDKFIGWIDDKAYDKLEKYSGGIPENTEDIYDESNDAFENIESSEVIGAEDDIEDDIEDTEDTDTDNSDDIEDALTNYFKRADSGLTDTINAIYSETGEFEDIVFIEAKEFYNLLKRDDIKDTVNKFYNGYDYSRNKLEADPNGKFFRFNEDDNIESSDYPESVYYKEDLDDIISYILAHIDADYYPDEILDILAEFT